LNSPPVVVTGARGYVGKRLVQQLRKNQLKVIEIDLLGPGSFDLAESSAAEKLSGLLPSSYDLIHLAFPLPGTMSSEAMTSLVRRVNFSLISLYPRPRRSLFISSTAVYTPDAKMHYSPWEVYGRMKAESEVQLADLGNLSILRPGTLIDAHRRSAVASLYFRALSGQLAVLPKAGSLAHPFLHVEDLVSACLGWTLELISVTSTLDLWAREPMSALDYLRARQTQSKIVSLPRILQRGIGSDSLPFFGISKWHLNALSYDVTGRDSGSSSSGPTKKMTEVFDELIRGS